MRHLPYILCLLLPLFVLNSCTDGDDTDENEANGMSGDCYISLSVNVPKGNWTRAAQSDGNADLSIGDEKEDKLNNAWLLLFKGNNVADAEYCGIYLMWDYKETGNDMPHLSNKYRFNITLWNFKKEDDATYYGLILANIGENVLRVNRIDKSFSYINNYGIRTDVTTDSHFKYSQLRTTKLAGINNIVSSDGYVLMTNATLTDTYGNATELVNVTDNIKEKQEDTAGNEATFYIERIAAKVQVTLDIPANSQFGGKNYKIEKWCLANLCPDTYMMRQWNKSWTNLQSRKAGVAKRFISQTTVGGSDAYRTYFCMSTYYGQSMGDILPESEFAHTQWTDFGKVQYCQENTLTVEDMKVKNSTHVLVKVLFDNNHDDTPETPYYYILPISHFGKNFTPWNDEEDGDELVQPIIPANYTELSNAQKATYEAENIFRSYPLTHRNDNYLGRWSCVRNTWYQLNITGITGFGSTENPIDHPAVILDDPTPLDFFSNHISCTVSVHNWVVREQNEVLQ